MSGPTPAIRRICWQRDQGACVRCRRTLTDKELQHRKARGMGGTTIEWINQPANLIFLCPPCHRWVESHERTQGVVQGYVIQGDEVAEQVEIYYQGRWAYLSDDGSVRYIRAEGRL